MGKTFAGLGIPFRLFEGAVEEAQEGAGEGVCSFCGEEGRFCFLLDVGAAVMVRCERCGQEQGLDAAEREDQKCAKCGRRVMFPDVGEEVRVCHGCLRAGRAAMTKDTELGMVSWEQAAEGVTHGVPRLEREGMELVNKGNGWVGARLPKDAMWELLRTPGYVTIQGEKWLFCCGGPMVFEGTWSREEFGRRAPDGDGRGYFAEVVEEAIEGLWEDDLGDVTGVYVFRCGACGKRRAHWDMA